MTNYKKINELTHLVDRAMSTCHYGRRIDPLQSQRKELS